jgi:hypothetical protein
MTESPFSTQGWNRYSYVGNSPLNFTDPSGYCFLGCFWKPLFKAIGNFFRQSWRAILQITVTAVCHLATGPNPGCAALGSFVSGLTSGNLGLALRGAAIAFFTAAAFQGVAKMAGGDFLAKVAGHAAVGCLSAVASGGRCGRGAVSAAAGAMGTQFGLIGSSVFGGLASVATGGNFANGAVTAAYGYLFNACGSRFGCTLGGLILGGAGGAVVGAGITAPAGGPGAVPGAVVGAAGVGLGGFLIDLGDMIGNALVNVISDWTAPSVLNSSNDQPDNPPKIEDFVDPDNIPEGWEWRGRGEPGSREGAYHNPNTGESLHNDTTHPPGKAAHWTYTDPNGVRWDNFGPSWQRQ